MINRKKTQNTTVTALDRLRQIIGKVSYAKFNLVWFFSPRSVELHIYLFKKSQLFIVIAVW